MKVKSFIPEYAGKLNFYVAAVNNLLKTDEDNSTIGLLICSDMNKTEVQWSFDSVTNPLGVAAYRIFASAAIFLRWLLVRRNAL